MKDFILLLYRKYFIQFLIMNFSRKMVFGATDGMSELKQLCFIKVTYHGTNYKNIYLEIGLG